MTIRVESLPFTVYDIVGYFIPGALFICITTYVLLPSDIYILLKSENFEKINTITSVFILFSFVIASYISGHVIGVLSAESIERIVLAFTGYPSVYIIKQQNFSGHYMERYPTKNILSHLKNKSFVFFSYIPLLPYSLLLEIFNIFGTFKYALKPLGDDPVRIIEKKFIKLFNINISVCNNGKSWFELAYYYMLEHSSPASQRAYNYVVIYGMLRNSSFVLYVSSLILFIKISFSLHGPYFFKPDNSLILQENSIFEVWLALIFLGVGAICLWGYIKFFRRFSKETLMAFSITPAPHKPSSR